MFSTAHDGVKNSCLGEQLPKLSQKKWSYFFNRKIPPCFFFFVKFPALSLSMYWFHVCSITFIPFNFPYLISPTFPNGIRFCQLKPNLMYFYQINVNVNRDVNVSEEIFFLIWHFCPASERPCRSGQNTQSSKNVTKYIQ